VAKEPRWQWQSRELDRKGGAQRLVHLLIEGCLPSDFVHAAASCPMVFARVLLGALVLGPGHRDPASSWMVAPANRSTVTACRWVGSSTSSCSSMSRCSSAVRCSSRLVYLPTFCAPCKRRDLPTSICGVCLCCAALVSLGCNERCWISLLVRRGATERQASPISGLQSGGIRYEGRRSHVPLHVGLERKVGERERSCGMSLASPLPFDP
jgi:hypothetical protein